MIDITLICDKLDLDMCHCCAVIIIITLGCCCNKANINCSAKLMALKRKYFRLLRYQKR